MSDHTDCCLTRQGEIRELKADLRLAIRQVEVAESVGQMLAHDRDEALENFARAGQEIGRLRQLLTKAASNGHVLMKHPPYGSSFLDCDLGPCTAYRAALKG